MAGPFARLRRGGDAGAEASTSLETAPDVTAGDAGANPTTEMPAAPPTAVIGAAMATPGDGAAATRHTTGDTAVLPAVVEQATPESETAGTEVVPADPPPDAPAPADQPADTEPAAEPIAPTFLSRGRLRRRLRYVRRAREIALRDLGGLVFDLHRFGRDRNDLVDQKLTALSALDAEMRALGQALEDPDDVTVLREPGLASCARCGALHAQRRALLLDLRPAGRQGCRPARGTDLRWTGAQPVRRHRAAAPRPPPTDRRRAVSRRRRRRRERRRPAAAAPTAGGPSSGRPDDGPDRAADADLPAPPPAPWPRSLPPLRRRPRARPRSCLDCGTAARTVIAPTPNWRLPIAVVAVAAVLCGAALAWAFVAADRQRRGRPRRHADDDHDHHLGDDRHDHDRHRARHARPRPGDDDGRHADPRPHTGADDLADHPRPGRHHRRPPRAVRRRGPRPHGHHRRPHAGHGSRARRLSRLHPAPERRPDPAGEALLRPQRQRMDGDVGRSGGRGPERTLITAATELDSAPRS